MMSKKDWSEMRKTEASGPVRVAVAVRASYGDNPGLTVRATSFRENRQRGPASKWFVASPLKGEVAQ